MNKVIHTKTQEQFNTVLELFENKNWTWATGEDPLQGTERWTNYRKQTCISLDNDELMFSGLDYYKGKGYEIISFEEFMNEINGLPKKWCIAGAHFNEVVEWFTKTIGREPMYNISSYFHYPLFNVHGSIACTSAEIQEGYTEISLQYFKDNILNSKEMKNEKIIGYKLKDQKYFIPASLIIFDNESGLKNWDSDKYMSISEHQHATEKAKEEGILDLWFEPVYEEEYKLPVINGYKGRLIKKTGWGDGILEYGCARIPTKLINDIYDINTHRKLNTDFNRKVARITLDTGVIIGWEQIQQIVNYLNNQ